MSWAELKRKYENGGCSASQSTEDMAARRILHCLGLTEKGIWKAERETGLDRERREDSTLYERASALARLLPGRFVLPPVRDVKSVKEAEDILLELCETLTFHPTSGFCAIVYRVKGSDDVRALLSKGDTDVLYVPEVPMPCAVRRSRDGTHVLLDCEAEAYYATILGAKGKAK